MSRKAYPDEEPTGTEGRPMAGYGCEGKYQRRDRLVSFVCSDPNCTECSGGGGCNNPRIDDNPRHQKWVHYEDEDAEAVPKHLHAGEAALPGRLLRVGCEERNMIEFNVSLTPDLVNNSMGIPLSNHEPLRSMLGGVFAGGIDGFHILPVRMDVMSSGNLPFPVSVQLYSTPPSDAFGSVGRDMELHGKSWFARNICWGADGTKAHGYIIPPGHHTSAWETRMHMQPTELQRQLALHSFSYADQMIEQHHQMPLATKGQVPILSNLAQWLAAVTAQTDEYPQTIVFNASHKARIKARQAELATHINKPQWLMALRDVRLHFECEDAAALKQAMGHMDPMMNANATVRVRMMYYTLNQEARDYVDEEEEEEEEVSGEV